jgi:hypothetical protein
VSIIKPDVIESESGVCHSQCGLLVSQLGEQNTHLYRLADFDCPPLGLTDRINTSFCCLECVFDHVSIIEQASVITGYGQHVVEFLKFPEERRFSHCGLPLFRKKQRNSFFLSMDLRLFRHFTFCDYILMTIDPDQILPGFNRIRL